VVACTLVLELTVDIHLDLLTLTDDISTIPLTDRLLAILNAILHWEITHTLYLSDLGTTQHHIVTSLTRAELALDSLWPNLIAILHALEETAIGTLADPTPLYMEFIIAILLGCTHITKWLTYDVDIAILNAINIACRSLILQYTYPTSKILTIEKLLLRAVLTA
jgi:hypothetical protein